MSYDSALYKSILHYITLYTVQCVCVDWSPLLRADCWLVSITACWLLIGRCYCVLTVDWSALLRAACEAFQVGGPSWGGISQQEVRDRCGLEPARHVLPADRTEWRTLCTQVQRHKVGVVRHVVIILSVFFNWLIFHACHELSKVGMCGMDFSSSVRFWEKPQVRFGLGFRSVLRAAVETAASL